MVTRREFTNALASNGMTFLSRFLARLNTPGLWSVRFTGVPSPCGQTDCAITEARSARTGANVGKTLVVTSDPLRLGGFLTVPTDGSIGNVATTVDFCVPTTAPTASPTRSSATTSGTSTKSWTLEGTVL